MIKIFTFDFSSSDILEQIIDWIYQKIVSLLGEFFEQMNEMGSDLFTLDWVQQITSFFNNLGWALFVAGIVVAIFEYAIESQNGRGDIKATSLNVLKGFMAVNLFTIVPVKLYQFSVGLQGSMSSDLSGWLVQKEGTGSAALDALSSAAAMAFSPIMMIFICIMMGYAVVKVFFSSLKRGGILLIQISVGSLYMFSVPRGYTDGFVMWIKQVIGICLTAFLQSTMLIAGLLIFKDHCLLGLGVMLAAGEIPRIAGAFGLETTTRANIMSAVHTAQSAVNLTKTITQVVAK